MHHAVCEFTLTGRQTKSVKTGAFPPKVTGEQSQVAVDNWLPCDPGTGVSLGLSSADGAGLWPGLLEKAYAKLHGGYDSLTAGSVGDALVDLTGAAVTKLNLSDPVTRTAADTG